MSHTPGEWSVTLVKGSYKQPALVKAGDKVVAQCIGDQLEPTATSIGEARANAKLIAAAPDLLEALDEVLRTYVEANLCPFGVSAYKECSCNYHAAVTKARAAIAKAKP